MAADFLDNFLAPLRALARRSSPTKEVGAGGTPVYGGYPLRREKSASLSGRERYRTFSEALANNPTVGASARIVLRLAARAPWSIEPAEDSDEAREIADFVEEAIYGMRTPWHRVVRRAATFILYGFSVQEWTMQRRDDGRLVYFDIEPRPQKTIDRWDLDTSGTVHTIIQTSPQTHVEIPLPRWKCVYAVEDSLDDSPEGLGLLRQIITTSLELSEYEHLEGVGYAVDLRGVPIGRAPLRALDQMVKSTAISREQADSMIAVMQNFLEEHVRTPDLGILLDSQVYVTTDEKGAPSAQRQWDVELLRSQGEMGHSEIGDAIERKKREIATMFGTEGVLLGSTGTGSLAMSKDKSASLRELVDSILNDLGEVFDADVVMPLLEMNGLDEELAPTLKPAALRHEDVEAVTAALKNLADAGAPVDPDDEVINAVRDLLGLPQVDLEEIRERMAEMPERPVPPQNGASGEDDPEESLELPANGRGDDA